MERLRKGRDFEDNLTLSVARGFGSKTNALKQEMHFFYGEKTTGQHILCSVCGTPIIKGDKMVEFMAGRVEPNAYPYLHHLHRLCFLQELWRLFILEGDDLIEALERCRTTVVLNEIGGK